MGHLNTATTIEPNFQKSFRLVLTLAGLRARALIDATYPMTRMFNS